MEKYLNQSKIIEYISEIKDFDKPNLKYEQYMTPCDLAAKMIIEIEKRENDFQNKTAFDLGCGTGMLTCCLLYLGFKCVVGIDIDEKCVQATNDRIDQFMQRFIDKSSFDYDQETEVIQSDLIEFDIKNTDYKCDLVLMNPPFGTKQENIDSKFLLKAFQICQGNIYSLHKGLSKKHQDDKNKDTIRNFFTKLAEQNNREIEFIIQDYQFELPKQESYKISSQKGQKFKKHHQKETEITLVDFICFKPLQK